MNKACNEVLEILNYVSTEMLDKLPRSVWEKLESEKDKNYKYKYDETTNLSNQNLLSDTVDIIAYLYVNYWTDEIEKKEFKDFLVKKELFKN